MEQVQVAWLAAGANGDVETMRRLRAQHPQWLDLNRIVGPGTGSDGGQVQRRFCSWKAFHLPTIGASALHTAAWDGNSAIVELLLEAGQDPDTPDNGNLTPIMVAMLRYNIVVMRCVFRDAGTVRRNLVVDCREDESEMQQRILAVIRLLQRFGGDVNVQSQEGSSALHYAANGDALEVARVLVNAGADIDAQDKRGKTPLHQCIHEGNLLVANLLVSRGAQIDVQDADGATPLTQTLQRRSVNMLQIILNHHHLVATDARRDFAVDVLMRAVECEYEEAIRLVIDGGYASITASNSTKETALHRAIVKRSPQLVQLLIEMDPAGTTLTATTADEETPAHYAARYGTARELAALLTRLALAFGDLAALDDDANPLNATNFEGATCLLLAGTSRLGAGNYETRDAVVRLLLQQGARLFLRGNVVVWSSSSPAEILRLHDQVHRGLTLWVREAGDHNSETADGDDMNDRVEARASDALLTELCVEWVASLAFVPSAEAGEHQTSVADLAAVLHVVIAAGYALEFVPLLLELPLLRSAMPALLRRLEGFSRFPRPHPLLLQFHTELAEALAEVAES